MRTIQLLLSTKEWHFGLKKHGGKRKFCLSMLHWPDSLQLGEPTRCSLLNLLPFSCCCLLFVVNNYCCAIWIPYSQTFHMQYFSNTWCWAFVVTLRAAEWNISSVGFFLCLQMAWYSTYFVTGINGLKLNICSHTRSNWMIDSSLLWFLSCLFKVPDVEHFCHSGSTWMVYHKYGFFHVSLYGLTLNIWSHNGSNWIVFQWW